jgi:hypothetical protein
MIISIDRVDIPRSGRRRWSSLVPLRRALMSPAQATVSGHDREDFPSLPRQKVFKYAVLQTGPAPPSPHPVVKSAKICTVA